METITPVAICSIEPVKSKQNLEREPMPQSSASITTYIDPGYLPITLLALAVSMCSLWALSDVFPSGGIWTGIKLAFGLGIFKACEWACNMAFAFFAMCVLFNKGFKKMEASHGKRMHSIGEDY